MIGLSVVNSESKSLSESPWGCSVLGWSLKRSTTLTNRILISGNSSRNNAVAARASCVGMSPAAIVTLPVPNPDTLGAVFDRSFHIQVLQMELLVRNDDVDVVLTSEAVVRH